MSGQPVDLQALRQAAIDRHQAGDLTAARDAYRSLLHQAPDDAHSLTLLAAVHRALGEPEVALPLVERAVALRPQVWQARHGLAETLRDLARLDEAEPLYRQVAEAVGPGVPTVIGHWAECLWLIGRVAEGAEAFARYQSSHRDWMANLSIDPATLLVPLDPAQPLWLQADAGFGDSLQFARYVPWLTQRGYRVIGWGDRGPMVPLIGASFPTLDCRADRSSPDGVRRVPLHALPHLAGLPDEAATAYLSASPDRIAHWRGRLGTICGPHIGPRIGLCWQGDPANRHDRQRSLDPAARDRLIALAVQAARPTGAAISLQVGAGGANFGLVDWTGDLADFADTAALVAGLDLVITVDTAIAHLAGALGKPVWILLPHVPAWRYGLRQGETVAGATPAHFPLERFGWYSDAWLFRQARRGDWRGVLDQVAAALAAKGGAIDGLDR